MHCLCFHSRFVSLPGIFFPGWTDLLLLFGKEGHANEDALAYRSLLSLSLLHEFFPTSSLSAVLISEMAGADHSVECRHTNTHTALTGLALDDQTQPHTHTAQAKMTIVLVRLTDC